MRKKHALDFCSMAQSSWTLDFPRIPERTMLGVPSPEQLVVNTTVLLLTLTLVSTAGFFP